MALIKCPECQKEISDQAKFCPNCGYKLNAMSKAEMQFMTGLMDTVCPPSTQYAVYNKLNCKKRHIIYPDFGYESINTAHDTAFMFFLE